eukprot:Gb_20902 [translate_table: standard]
MPEREISKKLGVSTSSRLKVIIANLSSLVDDNSTEVFDSSLNGSQKVLNTIVSMDPVMKHGYSAFGGMTLRDRQQDYQEECLERVLTRGRKMLVAPPKRRKARLRNQTNRRMRKKMGLKIMTKPVGQWSTATNDEISGADVRCPMKKEVFNKRQKFPPWKRNNLNVYHVKEGPEVRCDPGTEALEKMFGLVAGALEESITPPVQVKIGEVIASMVEGDLEDVNRAVNVALKVFDEGPWPRMTFYERSCIMYCFADLLEKHNEEIATLETWDSGKSYEQATLVELPMTVRKKLASSRPSNVVVEKDRLRKEVELVESRHDFLEVERIKNKLKELEVLSLQSSATPGDEMIAKKEVDAAKAGEATTSAESLRTRQRRKHRVHRVVVGKATLLRKDAPTVRKDAPAEEEISRGRAEKSRFLVTELEREIFVQSLWKDAASAEFVFVAVSFLFEL